MFGKIVTKFSKTIILYDSDTLSIAPHVEKWRKNRPADLVRVEEIKKRYEKCLYIDGIILGWYSNNKIHIYDGWTRFNALKQMNENKKLLISVNYTKNENDIIEHFIILNKAIPVPLLYTNEQLDFSKRILLEDLCKSLCEKYKPFVSSSRNPRIPNFNRDKLFDMLSEIDFPADFTTQNGMNILHQVNNLLKNTSSKIPQKAVQHNCFLFCVHENELKQNILKLLTL